MVDEEKVSIDLMSKLCSDVASTLRSTNRVPDGRFRSRRDLGTWYDEGMPLRRVRQSSALSAKR